MGMRILSRATADENAVGVGGRKMVEIDRRSQNNAEEFSRLVKYI
jgi:hypothetical protein